MTRLLVSPLLIALKKVIGDRDYIDYLRAFRYPLSGEFAMRTAMLPDLRIPSDWGLEIGVLVGGLAQPRAASRSARSRSPTATTTSTRT